MLSKINELQILGEIPPPKISKRISQKTKKSGQNSFSQEIVLGKKDPRRNLLEYNIQVIKFVKSWRGTVIGAIQDGTVRNDIDPTLIAQGLAALSTGVVDQIKRRKMSLKQAGFKKEDLIDALFEIMLHGIENNP